MDSMCEKYEGRVRVDSIMEIEVEVIARERSEIVVLWLLLFV
jgi:hypothetical protein